MIDTDRLLLDANRSPLDDRSLSVSINDIINIVTLFYKHFVTT